MGGVLPGARNHAVHPWVKSHPRPWTASLSLLVPGNGLGCDSQAQPGVGGVSQIVISLLCILGNFLHGSWGGVQPGTFSLPPFEASCLSSSKSGAMIKVGIDETFPPRRREDP